MNIFKTPYRPAQRASRKYYSKPSLAAIPKHRKNRLIRTRPLYVADAAGNVPPPQSCGTIFSGHSPDCPGSASNVLSVRADTVLPAPPMLKPGISYFLFLQNQPFYPVNTYTASNPVRPGNRYHSTHCPDRFRTPCHHPLPPLSGQ